MLPSRIALALLAAPLFAQTQLPYAVGADLSFLADVEAKGRVFKDNGTAKPGLQLFRDHGYNWIRLRLFHTPTRLPNSLPYTLKLASEAHKLGYKFLLDLHYSDTWADPGKQTLPKAWQNLDHAALVVAVRDYTREVVEAFDKAGVTPDMVQIGNEIIHGMLWPDGKLPQRWDAFAELVAAGIQGVDEASGRQSRPLIMIHIDRGGDIAATKDFFDNLLARGVSFDVIGQSYYPWWHGSLLDLRENLAFMAERYKRPIYVVEAAYCWRPTEYTKRPGPFPETPEGQRDFLDEVNRMVMATPNHLGAGVFWWEPAVEGGIRARGLFADDGEALPAVYVFDRFTRR